jgi:CRISPR-associated protein Csd2
MSVFEGNGSAMTKRHEFVFYFDVTNGNPNGDPDAGNMPRLDPETNWGLVSDVSLKRKIRNYVDWFGEQKGPGNEIFVKERRPLNPLIGEAASAVGAATYKKADGTWDTKKAKSRPAKEVGALQKWLCEKYFDIRTFGGVLSTGPNAGQIRGPVQLTFAKSVEAIVPLEQAITRVTDVDKEEGEMGRKHIVPYGLYRAHGFISAPLASHPTKGTGFSEADLDLLFEALGNMFEHDRSAARGEMVTRKLVVFRHESALGNAHAHELFARVKTSRVWQGERHLLPDTDNRLDNAPPARRFEDYAITVDRDGLPAGVELIER